MISKLDEILKKYKAYIYNESVLHGFYSAILCAPEFMVSPNDIAIKIFGNRDIIWLDQKDPISFMQEATELWNQTIDIFNQK